MFTKTEVCAKNKISSKKGESQKWLSFFVRVYIEEAKLLKKISSNILFFKLRKKEVCIMAEFVIPTYEQEGTNVRICCLLISAKDGMTYEVEDTRHRHSEKIFLSYFPYKPKKGCEKL